MYGIYKAIRRKNKKLLLILIGLFLALVLIPNYYFRIIPGTDFLYIPFDAIEERHYNFEITGHEFNLDKPIYEYETERAFNGDGYSIWVY